MSLDALRKFRAQEREALIMELARVTQELVNMEQRCEALEVQLKADAASCLRLAQQGTMAQTLLEWEGRLVSKQVSLRQAREAIGRLTDLWLKTQARLVDAMQAGKALDRLSERRKAEHEALVMKREQRVGDETASRRAFLKKGEYRR
ncbi:MAG: flagellar FliJ family protein [Nitrospira sp.]|nr:flagellar FliJ family protein [Nitrospira sp.]